MRWDFRNKALITQRTETRSPMYRNPLFQRGSFTSLIAGNLSLFFLIFTVVALGVLYGLLYSPLFTVTTIDINGGTPESNNKIRQIVLNQVNSRHLIVLRQNNLFSFSTNELRNKLSEQYSFQKLTIRKKLLHTLEVSYTEKKPVGVLQIDGRYFFIEENGQLSEERLSESTDPALINIVQEDTSRAMRVGDSLVTPGTMRFVIDTSQKLPQQTGIQISQWVLPTGIPFEIHLKTKDGWQIYFSMENDLASQYSNFVKIWNERFKASPPREYIDVRILDRVYYK